MVSSFVRAAVVWADLASISGLDPSSVTMILHILEAVDKVQFDVTDHDVGADAVGVVGHQFCFLCTNLHAIGCRCCQGVSLG